MEGSTLTKRNNPKAWDSLHGGQFDMDNFETFIEKTESEKQRLADLALDGQVMVEYAYGDMDHVS